MVKSFYGRLYFNLSQLRRVCRAGRRPRRRDAAVDGPRRGDPSRATSGGRRVATCQLRALPDFARIVWRHLRAARIVREHEAQDARAARPASPVRPASDCRTREIWARHRASGRRSAATTCRRCCCSATCCSTRRRCEGLRRGRIPVRAAGVSAAGGGRAVGERAAGVRSRRAGGGRAARAAVARVSAEPARGPRQLRTALRGTAFLAAFERFLEQYGHRGRYEYDWSLPRYHEDPTPLLQAIRAHSRRRPDARRRHDTGQQARGRGERLARLRGAPVAVAALDDAAERAPLDPQIKQYYVWREQVRSDLVRVIGALRRWHLVLADRFVARGWLDAARRLFPAAPRRGRGGRHAVHDAPATLRDIVADRARRAASGTARSRCRS